MQVCQDFTISKPYDLIYTAMSVSISQSLTPQRLACQNVAGVLPEGASQNTLQRMNQVSHLTKLLERIISLFWYGPSPLRLHPCG